MQRDGRRNHLPSRALSPVVRTQIVRRTACVLQVRLSPSFKRSRTNWKTEMLVAWAGMRGVVSLASALAIPLVLDDGRPFPDRNQRTQGANCGHNRHVPRHLQKLHQRRLNNVKNEAEEKETDSQPKP